MSKNIVMVGNPNVGKSVIFSQLTGARVMISNYTGTTVEYTQGQLHTGGETYQVIDAPGTYSLEPTCPAEEVTAKLVEKAHLIINVVDATNLERNLLLTRQLLERNVPMLVALNMIDDARRKGIRIDIPRLEELLGVPVVPTVAISGEGIKELVGALSRARAGGGGASDHRRTVGRGRPPGGGGPAGNPPPSYLAGEPGTGQLKAPDRGSPGFAGHVPYL